MNHKHIPLIDYFLPEDRIARYPLEKRSDSKLLVRFADGKLMEEQFNQLPSILPEKSLLVLNTTKVVHARLLFQKPTGAVIELFCLAPYSPSNHEQALAATSKCQWRCLIGNKRKWKHGKLSMNMQTEMGSIRLNAEVVDQQENDFVVEFSWDLEIPFSVILEQAGQIPIPPYLNRSSEELDKERYQTIYARHAGSVAAPTSGLHFTPAIIEAIKARGVEIAAVNLNVSAGTFQPVKTDNAREHQMHNEFFSAQMDELLKIARHDGPVISVGTTSMRTLESLYWLGVKSWATGMLASHLEQWENEKLPTSLSVSESLNCIVDLMRDLGIHRYNASTEIMIYPGYEIKVAQGLITNFHMPKSTLLLLVSAFIKGDIDDIYSYALKHDFRFLSYGDSSLLFR